MWNSIFIVLVLNYWVGTAHGLSRVLQNEEKVETVEQKSEKSNLVTKENLITKKEEPSVSYLNEILSKYNKFNLTQVVKLPDYYKPNNPSNNYLNYIITKNDYNNQPVFKPTRPVIDFVMPTTPPPVITTEKYEVTSNYYSDQNENHLTNNYNQILTYEPIKNALEKLQTPAKQVVIIYATPPPPTPAPITTKRPKKKNRPMTEADFMENLNFFRKYFTFNCTITRAPTHESVQGASKTVRKPTTIRPVLATTVRVTPRPTTKKPKIKRKTVYVDPPVVGQIENVFENVYDFMENALTDRVSGRNRKKNKPGNVRNTATVAPTRKTKVSSKSRITSKSTTTQRPKRPRNNKTEKRKLKRRERSIRNFHPKIKEHKRLDHSQIHPHHTLKFQIPQSPSVVQEAPPTQNEVDLLERKKREAPILNAMQMNANAFDMPPANPQAQYGPPSAQQAMPYPNSIAPTQRLPDITTPNPLDILALIPNPLSTIMGLSGPPDPNNPLGGIIGFLLNPAGTLLSLLPNPLNVLEDKLEMKETHVHEHYYLYPGDDGKNIPAPPSPPNIVLDTIKTVMMLIAQLLGQLGLGSLVQPPATVQMRYGLNGVRKRSKRGIVEDFGNFYYDDDSYEDVKSNGTKNESDDYSKEDDVSESTSISDEDSFENEINAKPNKNPIRNNKLPAAVPIPAPNPTKKPVKNRTQKPKRNARPNVKKNKPLNKNESPSWYYPTYFAVETSAPLGNEVEPLVTPPMTKESATESSWFEWDLFSDDDSDSEEEKTSRPIEESEEEEDDDEIEDESPGWFGGIFGGGTSRESLTTTAKSTTGDDSSEADEPLFEFKPTKWFDMIAQKIAKVTSPSPTVVENFQPKKIYYDNHQLWRIYPKTKDHVSYIEEYMRTKDGAKIQWWKGPSLFGLTDALVPSDRIPNFKKYLKAEKITYEVVIRDVQKAIYYSNPKPSKREQLDIELVKGHPLTFYRYHPYKEIRKFMEYTQRKNPKNAELIHIGSTFEGRPITIVKIVPTKASNGTFVSSLKNDKFMNSKKKKPSSKKASKVKRNAVLIEAGSIAREWLPVASSLWMIDFLVKHIDKDDSLGESLRAVDWYIMPVLNVDGYEYSHKYDRLWKKSRSEYDSSSANGGFLSSAFSWLSDDDSDSSKKWCFGVDLNRNWDYAWGDEGTSFDKCNQNYGGPNAFSELETKAFSKFIMQNKKKIKLFISLHAYGQTISYSNEKESLFNRQKYDDLFDMATNAIESLRATGSLTKYQIDSQNDLSFKQSGTSDHFAKNVAEIKYSYKIDLRDTGVHGFLLPPNHIESSASEAFQIIRGMVDQL